MSLAIKKYSISTSSLNFLNFWSLISALLIVNNLLAFTFKIPISNELVVSIYGVTIIHLFSKSKIKFNIILIGLVISITLSLLLNDIPRYFNAYFRFLGLLIILLLFSPLIDSKYLAIYRDYTLNKVIYLLKIIVILSILFRFTGIFPGNHFGFFRGISNHSMTLGPISGIIILNLIYKRNFNLFNIISLVTSIACLILSASRIALVSTIVSLVLFFLLSNSIRIKNKIGIVILLLFSLLSISQIKGLFEGINKKLEYQKETSLIGTREELFYWRIQEFEESPLYGIGFGNAKYGLINTKNGVIEPGSSWLVILSQTGVLGLFFILVLVLKSTLQLYSSSDSKLRSFHLPLIIFFVIHLTSEGYIFAFGNSLCSLAWLVLSFNGKNANSFLGKYN